QTPDDPLAAVRRGVRIGQARGPAWHRRRDPGHGPENQDRGERQQEDGRELRGQNRSERQPALEEPASRPVVEVAPEDEEEEYREGRETDGGRHQVGMRQDRRIENVEEQRPDGGRPTEEPLPPGVDQVPEDGREQDERQPR